MKISVTMPVVRACTAEGCAYNKEEHCHARAITVGGLNDHHCDTLFNSSSDINRNEAAGVGACKVNVCRFNDGCECQAASIEIGYSNFEADCETFLAP